MFHYALVILAGEHTDVTDRTTVASISAVLEANVDNSSSAVSLHLNTRKNHNLRTF
jgi:hypothetical protein